MICVLFCFPFRVAISFANLSRCGVFFRGIHVSEIHFRELSRNILKRIPRVPEQTHTETFVPHLPGESLYIIENIIPNYIELYIYIYTHIIQIIQ